MSRSPASCAPRKISSTCQGAKDEHELEDGFPSKAEQLFGFQGLIIGSVEANYFTPTQQQLIRDFVDRRGGGLLFTGGRATLSDGGYVGSPLEDLVPTKLPPNRGTFHRDFSPVELTQEGAQSLICRLDDNEARNAERWKKMPAVANYQEVGEPKPGASVLLNVIPPGRRAMPLLVTENYGRGRTARVGHRRLMALADVAAARRYALWRRSGSRCSGIW